MSNTFSNIESARADTDAAIRTLARSAGKGEVSRVQFLADAAAAFHAGTLGHVPTKKAGAEPTETHYAEHALNVWNAAYAEKIGKEVVPVLASRSSELVAIFKATAIRKDLVGATVAINKALADADGDYKGKSYPAVLKAARAQIAAAKVGGKGAALTDADIKSALTAVADAKPEEDKIAAVIKSLDKMADDYPQNADIYKAAKQGMESLLATLIRRAKRAAAEAALRECDEAEGIIDGECTDVTEGPAQLAA